MYSPYQLKCFGTNGSSDVAFSFNTITNENGWYPLNSSILTITIPEIREDDGYWYGLQIMGLVYGLLSTELDPEGHPPYGLKTVDSYELFFQGEYCLGVEEFSIKDPGELPYNGSVQLKTIVKTIPEDFKYGYISSWESETEDFSVTNEGHLTHYGSMGRGSTTIISAEYYIPENRLLGFDGAGAIEILEGGIILTDIIVTAADREEPQQPYST